MFRLPFKVDPVDNFLAHPEHKPADSDFSSSTNSIQLLAAGMGTMKIFRGTILMREVFVQNRTAVLGTNTCHVHARVHTHSRVAAFVSFPGT